MNHWIRATALTLAATTALLCQPSAQADAQERYRVLVSTDIGGSDPDDFQSMVHLLLYADVFDLEGLVSSPWGEGRASDILDVIDLYAEDYDTLKTWSGHYPEPDALRAITKQGAIERAPYAGVAEPTDGSRLIVEAARRDDPRPLYVLVWGGIEDLAQALHDAPDIADKLRVYWIGGPNKKWAPDAYQYIADHFPKLWIIESNATYRGWFLGGDQSGDLGNKSFVTEHIAGHCALGEYFTTQLEGVIKMGDTPSVSWLLHGDPTDPTTPGWGGQYVRAWKREYQRFDRLTTQDDRMERFGVLELVLPVDGPAPTDARLNIDNQSLPGHVDEDGRLRFRFTPKNPTVYRYTIDSASSAMEPMNGAISVYQAPATLATEPDSSIPNWWTDDPNPALMESAEPGVRTVSRWRADFLHDFERRMDQCQSPAPDTR